MLEDTRQQQPPPMEEVNDQLTAGLRQGRLTTYMNQLREQSKIEIIPAETTPAPAQSAPKQ